MKTQLNLFIPILGLALVGACADEEAPPPEDLPEGNASGGEDNTFDHPETQVDVWELLERLSEEGPPRYTSRVHSCAKIRYATVGRILESRGVNLGGAGVTAGGLYTSGDQALGAPNYAARARESIDLTTAGASRLFDIFVAAAPEIVTQMPLRQECMIGGVGTEFFDPSGACTADGIACLTGVPATPSHIELCNLTVQRASTPELGRNMAVAVIAAAAHTCE
jgi:hypothetical protein